MHRKALVAGIAVFGLFAASSARAVTILDFESLGLLPYGLIPSNYGDHAAGTPHVGVSYWSDAAGAGQTDRPNLAFWTANYGNLTNVAYPNVDLGETGSGIAATGYLYLTPDPGWQVVLNGFDVAGYAPNAGLYTGGNIPYSWLVTWSGGPTMASGFFGPAGTALSSHVSFAGPIVSSTPIVIALGGDWNVALDNVSFDETPVPEPGSLGLIGAGLLELIRRRRRQA